MLTKSEISEFVSPLILTRCSLGCITVMDQVYLGVPKGRTSKIQILFEMFKVCRIINTVVVNSVFENPENVIENQEGSTDN